MQRRAYVLALAAGAAEEEDVDTEQVARRLAHGVRDGRLVELPWAGHLPSLERPEETSRLVLDFVTRHVPGVSRS